MITNPALALSHSIVSRVRVSCAGHVPSQQPEYGAAARAALALRRESPPPPRARAGVSIGQVRASDVCVFNIGVHYNDAKLYRRELLDYFEAQCLRKRCLPCQVRAPVSEWVSGATG
jgi:hypothetical protein